MARWQHHHQALPNNGLAPALLVIVGPYRVHDINPLQAHIDRPAFQLVPGGIRLTAQGLQT